MSHKEVLGHVGDADVLVDQLLMGEMGVSSLEAMALGKVAVARVRDEVGERQPDLPVVSADPDTSSNVLVRGRGPGDNGHLHRLTGTGQLL